MPILPPLGGFGAIFEFPDPPHSAEECQASQMFNAVGQAEGAEILGGERLDEV